LNASTFPKVLLVEDQSSILGFRNFVVDPKIKSRRKNDVVAPQSSLPRGEGHVPNWNNPGNKTDTLWHEHVA